ncbi:MAG TPA: PorV/PorQ family protein, partial [Bacteroidales bacterium]|nr:PorV/PorQ family protein [Bacteroidales bacterium]
MKNNALIAGIILLLYLFNIPVTAQEKKYNAIQAVVPFLTIAPDSRAGALGNAGVATSADLYSMHWNPAKYAFIDGKAGFGMSYVPWLRALVNDINLSNITGFYRIDNRQVVAASLMYSALGRIEFTDEYGGRLMDINPNEFSVDAAYSRLF